MSYRKCTTGGIVVDAVRLALQATPEAKIQSPALMAVLNRLAVGADVSELVSIVCRVRALLCVLQTREN